MAASTYTFSQKAAPIEPGQLNYFGNIRRDGSRQPLTGILGNGFQTQDATGTPVTSPATVASNAVTTINVPNSACSITLIALTEPVLFSEASSNSALTSWSANYVSLPVGTPITIDIALQSTVYLLGSGGSSTVSFYWQIV